MTTRLLLVLAALAAAACAPKRIPGTDIEDTRENRAVYSVLEDYVQAMNQRDPAAVLTQVSDDYFDDAGTPEPADDLDRGRLEKALAEDLARVEASKLAVSLRKIEVAGDTAFAEIFYDSYYRVQTPGGPVPRRDSDVHRVRLKKVEGAWKITGGL
jgi:ketosteroid isomerase-like protein